MSALYQHDLLYRQKGFSVLAGIDEAGRGPLAGPVVASAVILPEEPFLGSLADSKVIPPKKREKLFWDILTTATAIGVGISSHTLIDRHNILQATRMAMIEAVRDLWLTPDVLLIDAVRLPALKIQQFPIIKADAKSAAVAAASIVAKHVRDALMLWYHDQYPLYNFRSHKGYGTVEHIRALRDYGPCPIHRKSFRKVLPALFT